MISSLNRLLSKSGKLNVSSRHTISGFFKKSISSITLITNNTHRCLIACQITAYKYNERNDDKGLSSAEKNWNRRIPREIPFACSIKSTSYAFSY